MMEESMIEGTRTMTSRAQDRLAALRGLLDERGLNGVGSDVAGTLSEIAALTAPVHLVANDLDLIRELTGEIKALGFQYVALDLQSAEVPG